MILYNLYSGGIERCSGYCKSGFACRNKGYTTDRSRGYWCQWHKDQKPKA